VLYDICGLASYNVIATPFHLYHILNNPTILNIKSNFDANVFSIEVKGNSKAKVTLDEKFKLSGKKWQFIFAWYKAEKKCEVKLLSSF